MSHIQNVVDFTKTRTDATNYAKACCGTASTLAHAATEFRKDATPDQQTSLLEALRVGMASRASEVLSGARDAGLLSRINGFAATLEQTVAKTKDFTTATTAFNALSIGVCPDLKNYQDDPDKPLPLNSSYPNLPLTSVGGWQVYDLLWHFEFSNPGQLIPKNVGGLLAREETPILVVGGVGQVLKFVVEVLPGPAGLVTPDWWPMGLIQFPQADIRIKDPDLQNRFADFLASTQRLLLAVNAGKPHRLRWRLEPWVDGDRLPVSLEGRSAEAAVACSGLAVWSRLQRSEDTEPVLNPCVFATAMVEGNETVVEERKLAPIWSLAEKCAEAAKRGIREAVIAMPKPTPLVVPEDFRITDVSTLGEAYFEMQFTNKFVREHQERMEAEFDTKWYLETTPQ